MPEQITRDRAEEKNGDWQPLVDYCTELYKAIEKSDYRQKKITEIEDSRRIYEQIGEEKTFPWKKSSNVVLPLVTITNDNLEPRLVAALIGKKPIVLFEMEGMQEKDEETKIIEDWYNSELQNFVKIENVARETVHDLLCDGTVYPISRYDVNSVTKRDFVFGEDGQIQFEKDEEGNDTGEPLLQDIEDILAEGGKIEFVKFTDMFVPDDATDWEKTEFIRIVRPTYFELMRLENEAGYMNIGPWLVGEEVAEKLTDDAQSPTQSVVDAKVTGKKTIECMECHISYVYQEPEQKEENVKDFTEERLVVLIAKESGILIRLILERELNFKNEHLIKRVRLYPERGRAYGTGIYGKMKAIQNGASDVFNLVMDIATVCMIPWFLYSNKAGIEGDVDIYPGKGVKCDDPKEVVFPKFQIQPRAFIDFIHLFFDLWEKLQSVGNLQVGKTSPRETTASEVVAVIQEGNIKHNYQSSVFKEEFLTVIRTLYDLYYQNMPFDKVYQYKGNEVRISRQSMKRAYKFKLTGSTDLANKVIERKVDEDFFTLLSQNQTANPVEALKMLVRSYKPDEDENKYVDPTINQLVMVVQENPEIAGQLMERIMQYAQEISGEGERGAGATAQ
ncbi:MAG: hypothetical protein JRJ57_02170 [Deltaproteobacteria bacterium]|nr:hypothetical protein [Deltaproteobacteria bacterium]